MLTAGFTYISSETPKVVLEIFYDQYVNHTLLPVTVIDVITAPEKLVPLPRGASFRA